jgi:hypothetical protein
MCARLALVLFGLTIGCYYIFIEKREQERRCRMISYVRGAQGGTAAMCNLFFS